MTQDQLLPLAKGAEDLRRFLIFKPIKAPAQYFAIQGNRGRTARLQPRFQ